MAEYIEREKLLRAMVCDDSEGANLFQVGIAAAKAIVSSAPTADVAPVVHGRWVKEVYRDPYGADWTKYHCSLCGRVEIKKEPYCNCGAKMDLKEEL